MELNVLRTNEIRDKIYKSFHHSLIIVNMLTNLTNLCETLYLVFIYVMMFVKIYKIKAIRWLYINLGQAHIYTLM